MSKLSEENILFLIDDGGNLTLLEKCNEVEKDHHQAFARLEDKVPGLLDGYQEELTKSGGYELACFVGATGNVIIWPSDINNNSNMIVTLPFPISEQTGKTLLDIMPNFSDKTLFVNIAAYRKPRSPKITVNDLSSGKGYDETVTRIKSYIDECTNIFGKTIVGDPRENGNYKK